MSNVIAVYLIFVILSGVAMFASGCADCGRTENPATPIPAHSTVARDEDAGEDAGEIEREWRQLLSPQPVRPPSKDYCKRKTYRAKRECNVTARGKADAA